MKKQIKIAGKSQTYHFPILIELDEDDIYIVSCPNFKGCHSYGKTVEEAMKNIKEVIELCLDEEPVIMQNKFVGFRELELVHKTIL